MKKRLVMILILVGAFGLGCGIVLGLQHHRAVETEVALEQFQAKRAEYKLEPPSQSLAGVVTNAQGGGLKQARDQVDPVQIIKDLPVLEDEQLIASPEAELVVTFAPAAQFTLSQEAVLSFVSTDPAHFTLKQDKGLVSYTTDTVTSKISVRSLHALLEIASGSAQIAVDPDKKQLEITVVSGTAQLGYINRDNQTQMLGLSAGQQALFDDEKRTVK
jgi:hypothetical protein